MSTHDKGRRAFLINTAAGVGAATTALLPETQAQAQAPAAAAQPQSMSMAMPMPHAPAGLQGAGQRAFFNEENAATVAAFSERIMPGAPGKPGANDVDVVNYIDLALSGPYKDFREFYRTGLNQLEAYCQGAYKKSFTDLTDAQKDEVIGALESGKATGFEWPRAQQFFATLRTHTIEGMFADPVYGGNKDFAGWRLVGFPGAQETFTPADLQSSGPYTRTQIMGMQSTGRRTAP